MIKEKEDELDIFNFIKKDTWFDVKEEEKEDFKNFCNIAEVKQANYPMMHLFEKSCNEMFNYPSLEDKTNDVDKIKLPYFLGNVFLYEGATKEDIKTAINLAMWEAVYKTRDKNKAIILMANIEGHDYEKFANEVIKKVKDQIKNKNGHMLKKIRTIKDISESIDSHLNGYIEEDITRNNNRFFYNRIQEMKHNQEVFKILKNKMEELQIDEITEENKDKLLESAFEEIDKKIDEYKEIGIEYEARIRNVFCHHNENLLHKIISEKQFLAIVEKTKQNVKYEKKNKERFFKEVMNEVDYITNNAERKIEDSTYTITCVSDKQSKKIFEKDQNIKINQNSKSILINTTKLFENCFVDKKNGLPRPAKTEEDKKAIAGFIIQTSRNIAKSIKTGAGKNISQNKIIKIRFIGENSSRLIYNNNYSQDNKEWAAADLIESLLETLLKESKDKKIIIIDDSSCESKKKHVNDLLKNQLRQERIAKFLLESKVKDKIQDLYIGSTLNGEQPEAEVMDKIKVDDKNKTIKSAKYFNLIDSKLVGTLYVKKGKQDFYQQQYDSLMTEPLRKEFEKNFQEKEISEDDLQKILTEVRGLDIEEARNKIKEKIEQNNQEKNVQNKKKIANTEKNSNISIENIEQNKVEERQNNVDKEEMIKKIKEEFKNIKDKLPDLWISEEEVVEKCVTNNDTTEEAIKEMHIIIASYVLDHNYFMPYYENIDDARKDQLLQSFKQGQNCNYEYIVKQMVIANLKKDYVRYIEDKTINEKFIEEVVLKNITELKNIKTELEDITNEIMCQILETRFEPQLKEGLLNKQTIKSVSGKFENETKAAFLERIIVKQIIEQQYDELNETFKTALKEELITKEEIEEKILKSENIEQAKQDIEKSIEVQRNKNKIYEKYKKDIKDINIDKETIDDIIELSKKDNKIDIEEKIDEKIKENKKLYPQLKTPDLEEKEIKQIIIKSNNNESNASNNIQYKIKQKQIENKFKKEIEEGILDSNFIIKPIKEDYKKDTSIIVKNIDDKIETIKQVSEKLMDMDFIKTSIKDKIIDEKEIYKVILNNSNNENIEKITEACKKVIRRIIIYTEDGLGELNFYDSNLRMDDERITKIINNIKLKAIKNTNNILEAKHEFNKITEGKEELRDQYRSKYEWRLISSEQISEIVYTYDTNEEIEKHILDIVNCNKLIDVYKSENYISNDKIEKIIQESDNNVETAKKNIENEINKNKKLLKKLLEEYNEEINKKTITESSISKKFFSNIEDLKDIRTIINRDILLKEALQLILEYKQFKINGDEVMEVTTDDLKQSRAHIFYKLLKQIERASFITKLSRDDAISIGQKYSKFEEFYEAIVNYSLLEKMKNDYADIIEQGFIDIEAIEKIIQETRPKSIEKDAATKRKYNVIGKIQLSVAKKMFKNEIENGLITEKELERYTQTPIDQYESNRVEKASFNLIKRNIIKQIIANLYEKGNFAKSNIVKAMEDFDENKSIAENIADIKDKYQQINKKNKKTYNELIEKYKKDIEAKNISKKEIKHIVETQCPEEYNYNEIADTIKTRIDNKKKKREIQKSLENLYAQAEMKFWNNFRKDLKTRPQINKMQQKKSKSK